MPPPTWRACGEREGGRLEKGGWGQGEGKGGGERLDKEGTM